MRYVFLALVVGATVVGAGWVALEDPVGEEWREDLLELAPFSAVENVRGEGVPPPGDRTLKRNKRRKRRSGVSSAVNTKPPKTPGATTAAPPPPPPPGAPSQADVHYQMGLAYLQQKKIPPAISELKKCIALKPKHAMAYRALGMAHSVMGKQRSAVEAFKEFVKLAPGHKDAAKVRAIIEAHEAGK